MDTEALDPLQHNELENHPAANVFGVDVHTERGWAVFDVRGDLDVYSAPLLRHEIREHLDRGENRLVVNLEDVDFLDSTGVSVMINGLKVARDQDGMLAVAHPGARVRRMLNLTNLDKVLPVYPTVEEAVGHSDRTR
jgi:anti-sigma B factor antagonist